MKSDCEKNSITSMATVTKETDKEVDEALKEEEKHKKHQANLKRYFYTLVSNAKKVLGGKSLAYYAETQKLFGEVIKLGISIDDWPNYIMNELSNNPNKWVDQVKQRKLENLYFIIIIF